MTSTGLAAANLAEKEVALEDVLLDANNPRLIGVKGFKGVPEARIAEPGVQSATLQRLNDNNFDMPSLRASIARSGLLLVDRVVVRPLDDKFVVVEGNRRIAACKTLIKQEEAGEVSLGSAVLSSITKPSVLVLGDSDVATARLDQWVIQGIRHISGARPWGAYQSAKTIEAMLEGLQYSEDDVVQALSITKQRVRRSMRVLASLAQMGEDEDHGDEAGPDYYAYFDEVAKRPAVRNWLQWSDDTKRFGDEEKFREFVSWITPDEELDGARKLPVAENVRSLDGVLEDRTALAVLQEPGRTITDALVVLGSGTEPEWREPLRRAEKALNNIPTSVLENLNAEDSELLTSLGTLISRRLHQARTLSSDAQAGSRARDSAEPH